MTTELHADNIAKLNPRKAVFEKPKPQDLATRSVIQLEPLFLQSCLLTVVKYIRRQIVNARMERQAKNYVKNLIAAVAEELLSIAFI